MGRERFRFKKLSPLAGPFFATFIGIIVNEPLSFSNPNNAKYDVLTRIECKQDLQRDGGKDEVPYYDRVDNGGSYYFPCLLPLGVARSLFKDRFPNSLVTKVEPVFRKEGDGQAYSKNGKGMRFDGYFITTRQKEPDPPSLPGYE